MAETITVDRVLDFNEIAPKLTLINVSVDHDGHPVMLFDEGRPAFPVGNDQAAVRQWYKTPPIAHHIVRYHDGAIERVRVPNESSAISTQFAQPFLGGWLLADSRNGSGRIYDKFGHPLRTINVGDAINDLQTIPEGLIWASYFDEGVFGAGIGRNGLVCFDQAGEPIFRYAELAQSTGLPPIDDCCALNVCDDRVWLSYYSDFPLVCLRDFQLAARFKPEASFNAFAMRDDTLLCVPSYGSRSMLALNLEADRRQELDPIDANGILLKDFRNNSYQHFASDPERLPYYKAFQAAGRNRSLYLYTEQSLYSVP